MELAAGGSPVVGRPGRRQPSPDFNAAAELALCEALTLKDVAVAADIVLDAAAVNAVGARSLQRGTRREQGAHAVEVALLAGRTGNDVVDRFDGAIDRDLVRVRG